MTQSTEFEAWVLRAADDFGHPQGSFVPQNVPRLARALLSERARADKAEAELARLREAARPFAMTGMQEGWHDDQAFSLLAKIGDLRALARAVGEEG